jgi:hypothetical protein
MFGDRPPVASPPQTPAARPPDTHRRIALSTRRHPKAHRDRFFAASAAQKIPALPCADRRHPQACPATQKNGDRIIRPIAHWYGEIYGLVQLDDYGVPEFEKWQKELVKFVYRRIAPSLSPDEYSALQQSHAEVRHSIDARVLAELSENPPFQAFAEDMTPTEFEHFCAEQLRRAGWIARVTTQSGDQGADVLAEKNNLVVVVQCKLYNKAVGNEAVQQASAARLHYKADHAIVISKGAYTSSAKQLAATNRVLLLHYDDLRHLDGILDMKR